MNSLRSLEDWTPPSDAVLKLQVDNVVRRIPAKRIFETCSSRGCYDRILQLADAYHPTSVQTDTFTTTYIDEDGDVITISSDREVVEAWQRLIPEGGQNPVPLRIQAELKKNIPAAECERKRNKQEHIADPDLIRPEESVVTLPALVTPFATALVPAETSKMREEVDTEIMLGRGSDKSNIRVTVNLNGKTFGSSSNDGSTSITNPIDAALCSDKLSAQDEPSKGTPRNQHSTQSQSKEKSSRDHLTSPPDNSDVGEQQKSQSSTSSSINIRKNGTHPKQKKRHEITPGASFQPNDLQHDDIESFSGGCPTASAGRKSKDGKRLNRMCEYSQHERASSDCGTSFIQFIQRKKQKKTSGSNNYCDPNQSQLECDNDKDEDEDNDDNTNDYDCVSPSDELSEEDDLTNQTVVDLSNPIIKKETNSTSNELVLEESENELGDHLVTLNVAQIAIGDKFFSVGCKMSFQTGGSKPFIGLHYVKGTRKRSSISSDVEEKPMHNICLDDESITELKYFLANECLPNHSIVGKQTTSKKTMMEVVNYNRTTLNDNPISFIAMKVMPDRENKLIKFLKPPDQSQLETDNTVSSSSVKSLLIVGKLCSNEEFKTKCAGLMEKDDKLCGLLQDAKLCSKQTAMYTEVLTKYAKKTKKRERKSKSAQDDILLVFPFPLSNDQMEEAAHGLKVSARNCGNNSNKDNSTGSGEFDEDGTTELNVTHGTGSQNSFSTSASCGQTHHITILLKDHDSLRPRKFLSPAIIDFWMQWILRKEKQSSSKVHLCPSYFMPTLIENGVDAVSRWTEEKSIDIFSKTFIFIPINIMKLHWSLCVIVNPGCIGNAYKKGSDSDYLPCILFLDSRNMYHTLKRKYAKSLHEWLNFEWGRSNRMPLDKATFNIRSMNGYHPKVPEEHNKWDSGMYVCRYAYALYQQQDIPITYRKIKDPRRFQWTVEDSSEFKFDTSEMFRLRKDMGTLISRLSKFYLEYERKEAKEKEGKKEKQTSKGDVF